jgi:hypothetical protein
VNSSAVTKGPATAAVARKLAQRKIYQEIGEVVDKCLAEAKAGSLGHAKFLVEWAQLMGEGAEAAKPANARKEKLEQKNAEKAKEKREGESLVGLFLEKLEELADAADKAEAEKKAAAAGNTTAVL